MLKRRQFLALTTAVALAACAPQSPLSMPEGTKLIILRHADRTDEDLNARGLARAAALVGALDGVAIDAIYTPDIRRNIDTAMPLAQARGLDIQTVSGHAAPHLMTVGAGKTIVWVGNKDNLHAIWEALALPGDPPLVYGELFTVQPSGKGTVTIARDHFGPR